MGNPFQGRGILTIAPITITAAVTSGAGTQTTSEYFTGLVWAVKAVLSSVTTPTITLAEADNMQQTILTQASAANFTKMPRAATHAAADGSAISGSGDPVLVNNSRLTLTIASGSGTGTVALTIYFLV